MDEETVSRKGSGPYLLPVNIRSNSFIIKSSCFIAMVRSGLGYQISCVSTGWKGKILTGTQILKACHRMSRVSSFQREKKSSVDGFYLSAHYHTPMESFKFKCKKCIKRLNTLYIQEQKKAAHKSKGKYFGHLFPPVHLRVLSNRVMRSTIRKW